MRRATGLLPALILVLGCQTGEASVLTADAVRRPNNSRCCGRRATPGEERLRLNPAERNTAKMSAASVSRLAPDSAVGR